MNILKQNYKKILYLFVLFCFVITVSIIGFHHEPWADEAQAWLLSRDCSLFELVSSNLRYEGHPILWYLILKFFIFFKLPYNFYFVIPVIFSCLGLWLFLFKTEFNLVLKLFFPFTYFIFYQYAVVARSYCLVFPALILTCIFWSRRFSNPFLFFGCLIFLFNICFYTQVLACCIVLFYVYELFKSKNFYQNSKIYILAAFLFILNIMFNIYLLHPASDFPFHAYWHFKSFSFIKFFKLFALSLFSVDDSKPSILTAISLYFLLPFLFFKI